MKFAACDNYPPEDKFEATNWCHGCCKPVPEGRDMVCDKAGCAKCCYYCPGNLFPIVPCMFCAYMAFAYSMFAYVDVRYWLYAEEDVMRAAWQ